jgi:hypothetical protein
MYKKEPNPPPKIHDTKTLCSQGALIIITSFSAQRSRKSSANSHARSVTFFTCAHDACPMTSPTPFSNLHFISHGGLCSRKACT